MEFRTSLVVQIFHSNQLSKDPPLPSFYCRRWPLPERQGNNPKPGELRSEEAGIEQDKCRVEAHWSDVVSFHWLTDLFLRVVLSPLWSTLFC